MGNPQNSVRLSYRIWLKGVLLLPLSNECNQSFLAAEPLPSDHDWRTDTGTVIEVHDVGVVHAHTAL